MNSVLSKQNVFLAFLFGLAAMMAGPAAAQSAFAPLTAAVTFTDVIAAIMAVAAIIAGLYVTMRGVNTILGFIRR